jgi:hypothetical protein
MVVSLLRLAGPDWPVPDFSTLCRRQKTLAVEFTPSRDGDSPVLPDLLGQILGDEQIGTVTADGAYDTRRCHRTIVERDAVPIIPNRKNGRA